MLREERFCLTKLQTTLLSTSATSKLFIFLFYLAFVQLFFVAKYLKAQ